MQPIFTMQYGEFAVADYLSKHIKEASVFVPASAQEKGIDLLMYKFTNGTNLINTIQVKTSRTYYNISSRYQGTLWFNRFEPQDNADWFILVGIYANCPQDINASSDKFQWDTIMLAFKNKEMKQFMKEVRLKTNIEKRDKMFGFGFNGKDEIKQTRGYFEERDMTQYLIENRINEIRSSFR
ncbi:hypothetical protein WKT02_11790 [Erysipelotrichaceae bacterium HCN-30851]